MAEFEHILFEVNDGIATITLNRPEKLNAYITPMGEEVTRIVREVRDDDEVRAIILTGAGRGFCAGVDLDHLKLHQAGGNAAGGAGPRLGEEDFLKKLPLEMLEYPKPIIGAVNGAAIGVGVTMLLPCDVRIAAAGVKMGLTFTKLGILPGLGSTHLLPKLVGRAKALELVLTARVFVSEEAERIGLVNKVVPGDELLNEAREWASLMAEKRPDVLAAAKQALDFGEAHGMQESMRNEERSSAELRRLRGQ
ncbi:MAG: enoyl-CoA hydratase/isomerase family protein [Deltaproteobacteria bacterium]|nr:enoyl-CoA hydratase/isomerase family protein [Deltaproteobacteria bacterium]MBW2359440.1 enoyl-CoA hydratase/isomerase family protein [Deltaproteobacteria bacterium]